MNFGNIEFNSQTTTSVSLPNSGSLFVKKPWHDNKEQEFLKKIYSHFNLSLEFQILKYWYEKDVWEVFFWTGNKPHDIIKMKTQNYV